MSHDNDNLTSFPATTTMTPEQALASAMQFKDLKEVLVIATDADDNLLIRSSRMNNRDALWLLTQAKNWMFDPRYPKK